MAQSQSPTGWNVEPPENEEVIQTADELEVDDESDPDGPAAMDILVVVVPAHPVGSRTRFEAEVESQSGVSAS